MDYPKNLCRLCLNLSCEGDLTPLFENYANEENVALEWRRIFSFIYNIEGLPDKICNNCKGQAEWILNFHKQCYDNDAILRLNQMKKTQLKFSDSDCQDTFLIDYKANNRSSDEIHEVNQEYDTKDFEDEDEQMAIEQDSEGIFSVEDNDLKSG